MSVLVELFAVAPLEATALEPHHLDLAALLDGAESVNLDREWQAVERALSKSDPAWQSVFESGTQIDAETFYLSPEDVARRDAALAGVDPAQLRRQVDELLAAPGDLYGGPWTAAEAPLLVATIERLARFWRTAAARGRALLVVWG